VNLLVDRSSTELLKADCCLLFNYHGGAVEEDGAVAEPREELLLGLLAAVEEHGLVGARQDSGAVGRQEPCPDGAVGVGGGLERRRRRGRVARVAGRGQRDGVRHALLRQPVDLRARAAAVHANRT
jgi:hypothetical protein